jgi:hypothetical protein
MKVVSSSPLLNTYVNGMEVAKLKHQRGACERAAISPVNRPLTCAARQGKEVENGYKLFDSHGG